eukprot:Rhum_TRINITY_DN12012_c1_g1::Rhum_TRINITY_DN12012_c1_g1_i1::g.48769::m.48769
METARKGRLQTASTTTKLLLCSLLLSSSLPAASAANSTSADPPLALRFPLAGGDVRVGPAGSTHDAQRLHNETAAHGVSAVLLAPGPLAVRYASGTGVLLLAAAWAGDGALPVPAGSNGSLAEVAAGCSRLLRVAGGTGSVVELGTGNWVVWHLPLVGAAGGGSSDGSSTPVSLAAVVAADAAHSAAQRAETVARLSAAESRTVVLVKLPCTSAVRPTPSVLSGWDETEVRMTHEDTGVRYYSDTVHLSFSTEPAAAALHVFLSDRPGPWVESARPRPPVPPSYSDAFLYLTSDRPSGGGSYSYLRPDGTGGALDGGVSVVRSTYVQYVCGDAVHAERSPHVARYTLEEATVPPAVMLAATLVVLVVGVAWWAVFYFYASGMVGWRWAAAEAKAEAAAAASHRRKRAVKFEDGDDEGCAEGEASVGRAVDEDDGDGDSDGLLQFEVADRALWCGTFFALPFVLLVLLLFVALDLVGRAADHGEHDWLLVFLLPLVWTAVAYVVLIVLWRRGYVGSPVWVWVAPQAELKRFHKRRLAGFPFYFIPATVLAATSTVYAFSSARSNDTQDRKTGAFFAQHLLSLGYWVFVVPVWFSWFVPKRRYLPEGDDSSEDGRDGAEQEGAGGRSLSSWDKGAAVEALPVEYPASGGGDGLLAYSQASGFSEPPQDVECWQNAGHGSPASSSRCLQGGVGVGTDGVAGVPVCFVADTVHTPGSPLCSTYAKIPAPPPRQQQQQQRSRSGSSAAPALSAATDATSGAFSSQTPVHRQYAAAVPSPSMSSPAAPHAAKQPSLAQSLFARRWANKKKADADAASAAASQQRLRALSVPSPSSDPFGPLPGDEAAAAPAPASHQSRMSSLRGKVAEWRGRGRGARPPADKHVDNDPFGHPAAAPPAVAAAAPAAQGRSTTASPVPLEAVEDDEEGVFEFAPQKPAMFPPPPPLPPPPDASLYDHLETSPRVSFAGDPPPQQHQPQQQQQRPLQREPTGEGSLPHPSAPPPHSGDFYFPSEVSTLYDAVVAALRGGGGGGSSGGQDAAAAAAAAAAPLHQHYTQRVVPESPQSVWEDGDRALYNVERVLERQSSIADEIEVLRALKDCRTDPSVDAHTKAFIEDHLMADWTAKFSPPRGFSVSPSSAAAAALHRSPLSSGSRTGMSPVQLPPALMSAQQQPALPPQHQWRAYPEGRPAQSAIPPELTSPSVPQGGANKETAKAVIAAILNYKNALPAAPARRTDDPAARGEQPLPPATTDSSADELIVSRVSSPGIQPTPQLPLPLPPPPPPPPQQQQQQQHQQQQQQQQPIAPSPVPSGAGNPLHAVPSDLPLQQHSARPHPVVIDAFEEVDEAPPPPRLPAVPPPPAASPPAVRIGGGAFVSLSEGFASDSETAEQPPPPPPPPRQSLHSVEASHQQLPVRPPPVVLAPVEHTLQSLRHADPTESAQVPEASTAAPPVVLRGHSSELMQRRAVEVPPPLQQPQHAQRGRGRGRPPLSPTGRLGRQPSLPLPQSPAVAASPVASVQPEQQQQRQPPPGFAAAPQVSQPASLPEPTPVENTGEVLVSDEEPTQDRTEVQAATPSPTPGVDDCQESATTQATSEDATEESPQPPPPPLQVPPPPAVDPEMRERIVEDTVRRYVPASPQATNVMLHVSRQGSLLRERSGSAGGTPQGSAAGSVPVSPLLPMERSGSGSGSALSRILAKSPRARPSSGPSPFATPQAQPQPQPQPEQPRRTIAADDLVLGAGIIPAAAVPSQTARSARTATSRSGSSPPPSPALLAASSVGSAGRGRGAGRGRASPRSEGGSSAASRPASSRGAPTLAAAALLQRRSLPSSTG